MRATVCILAIVAIAADFKDVNPNVFGPDDPRTKDLPKIMANDVKRRMQEACLRESKAFAEVTTKAQWTRYRDIRIQKLKESLGAWPEPPKDMRIIVTRKLDGDGFVIHNIVYESRPGLWVSANLYLPSNPPAKMPGILISHSHHTPKTHGELQDMGMTWARSGVAVLVPDHLGHGERRQHDFVTEKDYDKPFKLSRQDYYFRYNSNLQLSAAGECLMGWMVWDLMRGIDVLLKQPTIDKDRLILLGAVAGGGDPAGVTAALDPRIACVVPFNFGGWQPESSVTANPDRDFAWFGEGYWESTRGLRNGARDGFAHYVIVGSVAPRKVIYAHEFAWDPKTDPAWPRLQKIFGFYDAKDALRTAHGAGSVRNDGPGNTHCTHIGATHRKMIYPALKDWFGMAVPEEYSQRRPAADLICWTEAAKKKLGPKMLHEVLGEIVHRMAANAAFELAKLRQTQERRVYRDVWAKLLGDVEPLEKPKLIKGNTEDVPGGKLARLALEVEPGILVPFYLVTPADVKVKSPVVVMLAQGGKAGFLKERGEVIAAFLKAGVAVCLVDVRGTGETRAGNSAERGSARTSISQTNLILGQTVIGSQLRDLRTVIQWLQSRERIDSNKLAVWGDSFARVNAERARVRVPLDAADFPAMSEPAAELLTLYVALYEDGVKAIHTHGGVRLMPHAIVYNPYLYVPHECIVPNAISLNEFIPQPTTFSTPWNFSGFVDETNQVGRRGHWAAPSQADAKWVIEKLTAK